MLRVRLSVTFSPSVRSTRLQKMEQPLPRMTPQNVGTSQNTPSRLDVHHTDLVVRTLLAGPRSTLSLKWPAAAAPQKRQIKKWLDVRLSVSVVANAVFTDRTKCSQAPLMFGTPGGINFHVMVLMLAFFFVPSCTSRMYINFSFLLYATSIEHDVALGWRATYRVVARPKGHHIDPRFPYVLEHTFARDEDGRV
ncbi:hypothetical protein EVAR_22857_1 [Eumeta japonica]|uniref:Uncharacterized protein n=1 Tax=Eumeta variegata TaxID=151549 RepID=A0A4C1UUI5_EUMVA|nr:hypothetical protein EVAR_22857_1 [Eumeta japonica]